MLSDLQQLLACRRERESRAASALRQARLKLEQAKTAAASAHARLERHHQDRRERQDKLYRSSERARLTKYQIDDLNIELDLIGEQTAALVKQVDDANAVIADRAKAVEEALTAYRRHRKAGDRWGHLVDDVAVKERRKLEQAEDIAIEDDLGDRRASSQAGM